jgi:rhamnulokinase
MNVMQKQHFLAIDFGAEFFKATLGTLVDRKIIELQEINRSVTGQISLNKHYYWDVFQFYKEIIESLQKCVNEVNIIPQSIGITAWGVDFGLIGKDGSLLRIPYSYRDRMTETSMPSFLERMGRADIYQNTGIALHKFNTVFQLYAMIMANDEVLTIADKLLFMPDLINYFLTGEAKSELTIATTSQLYNPVKKGWDKDIVRKLGIDIKLLPDLVQPGTILGVLNESISRAIDVDGIRVISVTSHETAAAVAAIPAEGDDWAYISSGTWSLFGVEKRDVMIDQRSMVFNMTNEGGAEETFRFQKSIIGLWILQECRKSWRKNQGILDYTEIIQLAENAEPFSAFIDPDYPGFYNPLDMPAAIDTFCRQTGQVSPKDIGTITRTVLESLAFKYRMVLEQIEMVTTKRYNTIHIIGGGAQNELLCQFTANATGRLVVTGPIEAASTGNILVQAMAMGYLKSLAEIREVVRNSFDLKEYIPEDKEIWERNYNKFRNTAKPK